MIQGSFPLWVLKNKCTIPELWVKIYIHSQSRAGTAADFTAAAVAAASSEGPGRRGEAVPGNPAQ